MIRGPQLIVSYTHPAALAVALGVLVVLVASIVWVELESGGPLTPSPVIAAVVIGIACAMLGGGLLRQRDRLEIDFVMGTAELRKYSGILSETTSIDTRRLSVAIRPIAVHQPRWPTWNGYALVLCEGERPVMALSIRRTLAECRKDCSAFPDALMKGLTERTATIHAASAY